MSYKCVSKIVIQMPCQVLYLEVITPSLNRMGIISRLKILLFQMLTTPLLVMQLPQRRKTPNIIVGRSVHFSLNGCTRCLIFLRISYRLIVSLQKYVNKFLHFRVHEYLFIFVNCSQFIVASFLTLG